MIRFIAVFALFFFSLTATTHAAYKKTSIVRIYGQSTLGRWVTTINDIDVRMDHKTNLDLYENSFSFNVPASELKSNRSFLDSKIKSDFEDHNIITVVTSKIYKVDNNYVQVLGSVKVGDQIKEFVTFGKIRERMSGTNIRGEFNFKLSEFGIEAPERLFGLYKAKDDVRLVFDVMLIQEKKTGISSNSKKSPLKKI